MEFDQYLLFICAEAEAACDVMVTTCIRASPMISKLKAPTDTVIIPA